MKRLVVWSVAGILSLLWGAAGTAHSAMDMQEGEWETTIQTTISMPGMSMPPMVTTVRECLTREDAVPGKKDKNCKVTKMKAVGNTVSWGMVCEEKGARTESEGEVTYHGTSYQGSMRGKIVEGGETMTTLMKLSGKRLGACTGKKTRVNNVETEKLQAKAAEAKAKGDAVLAKMKTPSKRAAAILNAKVPEQEPDACLQKGFTLETACQKKVAGFPLKPGLYEVVAEKTGRYEDFYNEVEEEREKVCLSGNTPVPKLATSLQNVEVTWGKERIVWTWKDPQMIEQGGIVYRETAFEGVVTRTAEQAGAGKVVNATRVTGKRLGDGDCIARDYTAAGRSYTAQPKEGSPVDKTKDLLKNPVKGIRNLFKF